MLSNYFIIFVSRHLKKLRLCFNSADSPFELRYTDQFGFGVYAKRDITSKDDLKLIRGLAQINLEDKVWFSQVETKSEKYDLPLVGSVNFTNHGCERHSTINIIETDRKKYFFGCDLFECEKKEKDKIITVKVTKINEGDEILWPYGFTGRDKMKCVACVMEEQEDRKIDYGVRVIKTKNSKRKKRDDQDATNSIRNKRKN